MTTENTNNDYVIGLDFGTDSVRAVVVDTANGDVIASATEMYERWGKGMYCDASHSRFRQHPLDHIEGLEKVLKKVTCECGSPESIRAISVDTTASTPCLTDRAGVPLSLKPEYSENPDAMFILWKDHTGQAESEEITSLCAKQGHNYASHSGNHYSAECYWSKVLHVIRKDEDLRRDAWSAMELCDWIPFMLTGNTDAGTLKSSHCAAGTKQMWAEEWGGFPPEEFFSSLDPDLGKIAGRLAKDNFDCGKPAGHLCKEWAERTGLSTDVLVGVGNVDSHSGGVGAGISHKTMILNIGTSAGYMAVMPIEKMGGRIVDGIFNQVNGSILPGMVGFEAGLSAFGDLYAWLRKLLAWPLKSLKDREEARQIEDRILYLLGEEAAALDIHEDSPVATDYFNGRRCPDPDSNLTGTIAGLTLGTSAPQLYYALAEATAFATKAILDHLQKGGIDIERFIAVGGISQKSPFVMQLLADVTGLEISISSDMGSCAMGSAIHAAVVAGIYLTVEEAQNHMVKPTSKTYFPDREKKQLLDSRYRKYLSLGKASASII